MLRTIIVFLFSLLFCISAQAKQQFDQIIFFGDSLTDNGNIYKVLLKVLPKSPPYFEGRFTNGYTWAEHVGKYFHEKQSTDYKIYAYGGATAVFRLPSDQFVDLTTLELEVNLYLIQSLFEDRSNHLFTIWIGGNDYLYGQNDNPNTLTDNVIAKINWAMSTLKYYGANNFLILNLPDLAMTPQGHTQGSIEKLHNLTVMHNQKLAVALQAFKKTNPDIHITTVDIFDLFNQFIVSPSEMNKKYHVNITNTRQSCWEGGYFLNQYLSEENVMSDLRQSMLNEKSFVNQKQKLQGMSRLILQTPSLTQTYLLGKSYTYGNVPCVNPNEYLFWDFIHPTQTVHWVLSQVVLEQLAKVEAQA